MNSYILDTNVLISFVTDRNLPQQNIIRKYFEDAASVICELLICDIVINEFVYVMEHIYNIKSTNIAGMLRALIKMPGIKLVNYFDPESVLELWPLKINDYGDAVLASFAKSLNKRIITFDRKFTKQLNKGNIPILKDL
jgi:predicted nucleic acid-binding protein